MPEFMLEEDPIGPRQLSGGLGPHAPSKVITELAPKIEQLREHQIVGKWFKVARYPKRDSARNAVWTLREHFGKDHFCQGFTFQTSADLDENKQKLSDDTLIYVTFDPSAVIEGAEAKWQEEVQARIQKRKESAAKTNANKKARDARAKAEAAAAALGVELNLPPEETVAAHGATEGGEAEAPPKKGRK